jgi:hypothetical protein
MATRHGHKDVAELLLANKANVNAKDSGGKTPMHAAVDNGHTDVVELLLKHGGTANAAANTPAGSKVELISVIAEMSLNKTVGEEKAVAKAIAASKRFDIDVVKELVLDSFFDNLPMNVSVGGNTLRSVSMHIGATMGDPSFAKWLAENIVVGRRPAQMIDNPCKYGSWGMWQDAKALCEKLGVSFSGPA